MTEAKVELRVDKKLEKATNTLQYQAKTMSQLKDMMQTLVKRGFGLPM